MGKLIVIKGADFSQNAILKQILLPKVTMDEVTSVSIASDVFRAWGPYIENESTVVGAKLFLPSASEA